MLDNEEVTILTRMFSTRFSKKIANAYADSERPITLVLNNARYQKCQSVANKAKELNIELLYLPPNTRLEFDRTIMALCQKNKFCIANITKASMLLGNASIPAW
ncbi:MAG: hypothetical protein ACXW1W_13525 [Methylococcaceae bacterium]